MKPKADSLSNFYTVLRRGALAGLLLLLAGGLLPPSQAPGQSAGSSPPVQGSVAPQAGNNYVVRVQRNEVQVDVRVFDKSGKPVNDLKQQDFKIFEDGTQQTINAFNLENVDKLVAATAESGTPPVINLAKLPPEVQPQQAVQDHRLMVLFIDLSSMPPDDLMRALKAAGDFVRKRLTPADLVAVITYSSSLRVMQDFTNDRDALDKALRKIQVGESADLAQSGTIGAAGGTDVNGGEIVTQDVSAAFTPDETEFNIFNTDEKLAAIESLARMLRGVPGRKSVIHFSSGIERTGIENQAQLRATVDAANQANVSLYTMDARGLVALPPGGDGSSASPAGNAVYSGSAAASQVSSLHGGRETLASLSSDTGGRTFYDLNDFAPAFEEIQKENSTYYLLGYTPSNNKSDGRFRRIRVEVSRPGVKVQARPGYFAPKDFRQYTREDKDLQLQQAMELDSPFVDLPLAVETAFFRQNDKNFYVVLAAKIPGSAISFLQKSQSHRTEFDFAWRALRVGDKTSQPAGVLRDTLPVKLDAGNYEQVLAGNFLYEGGIVLPPGKYTLKVVVRENESGKLGTFEQTLDLPDTGASSLSLSSVVLSNQLQGVSGGGNSKGKKNGENPLQVGAQSILPSVTRVFRTNQNLYVYLESYDLSKPAKSGEQLTQPMSSVPPAVALVFFRGNVKISEAGPFPGKLERTDKNSSGKTTYFVQVPLEKFPTGRYRMQLNVLNPSAGQAAFAHVPLAIMKPPVPVPARTGK